MICTCTSDKCSNRSRSLPIDDYFGRAHHISNQFDLEEFYSIQFAYFCRSQSVCIVEPSAIFYEVGFSYFPSSRPLAFVRFEPDLCSARQSLGGATLPESGQVQDCSSRSHSAGQRRWMPPVISLHSCLTNLVLVLFSVYFLSSYLPAKCECDIAISTI